MRSLRPRAPSGRSGCTPRGRVHCNDVGQSTDSSIAVNDHSCTAQSGPDEQGWRVSGDATLDSGRNFTSGRLEVPRHHKAPSSAISESQVPRKTPPRRSKPSGSGQTGRFLPGWLLALFSMSSVDAAFIVRRRRTGEKSLSRVRRLGERSSAHRRGPTLSRSHSPSRREAAHPRSGHRDPGPRCPRSQRR